MQALEGVLVAARADTAEGAKALDAANAALQATEERVRQKSAAHDELKCVQTLVLDPRIAIFFLSCFSFFLSCCLRDSPCALS